MKRIYKASGYITLLLALALTACERRPLEEVAQQNNSQRVEIDWMTRFGTRPTGMTFGLWNSQDGQLVYIDEDNNVDRHSLPYAAASYNLLVFNTTAIELDMYHFELNNYRDASITIQPATRATPPNWAPGTVFAQSVEPIAVATDTISVTTDMLTGQWGYQHHPRTRSEPMADEHGDYYYVLQPQDATTLLSVRIRVFGLRNMGTVEGGLTGMAAQYLLSRHSTTNEQIAHLLEKAEWRGVLDDDDSGNGWIAADIRVLGLPGTVTRQADETTRDSTLNHLTLDFLLADGKTPFRFERNVGNLLRYVEDRDIVDRASGVVRRESYYVDHVTQHLFLVVSSVPLPDLPEVERISSGFDAQVDPWQTGETVGVDMARQR